ncbi:hypothetical protein EAO70_27810 [Streptomyces sp. adm13(2018)]|nr:hypothetical protein EAO70_27810 [Streptomyces sp. adm13(2018)]
MDDDHGTPAERKETRKGDDRDDLDSVSVGAHDPPRSPCVGRRPPEAAAWTPAPSRPPGVAAPGAAAYGVAAYGAAAPGVTAYGRGGSE